MLRSWSPFDSAVKKPTDWLLAYWRARPEAITESAGVASVTVPLASLDVDGERAMAAVASLVPKPIRYAAQAVTSANCSKYPARVGSVADDINICSGRAVLQFGRQAPRHKSLQWAT